MSTRSKLSLIIGTTALALMLSGTASAVVLPNPSAYFPMNEGAGATTADTQGGPSGSLVGATIGWTVGHTGAAGDNAVDFKLTGDGNAVSVATGAFAGSAVANDAISFSFWQLNPGAAAANESSFWAVSPTADGGARGAQAHVPWGNGTVYWDTSGCCTADQRISALSPAANYDATWHHWVFQKDAAGRKEIWVDGSLFLGVNNASAEALETFTSLVIGAGSPSEGNSFSGYIDDFAVYDVALTSAQIEAIAAGQKLITPEPTSLLLATMGLLGLGLVRRRRRSR